MRKQVPTGKAATEESMFWLSSEENWDRYIWAARYAAGKKVLDVACGRGMATYLMAEAGASQVVGGDILRDYVLFAKRNFERQNVFFVQLDASNLPLRSGYFDTVVVLDSIEHVAEYRRLLSECWRVLKPSGLIICSTHNRRARTEPGHVVELDASQFRNLLTEAGFSNLQLYGHRPLSVAGRMTAKLTFSIAELGRRLLLLPPFLPGSDLNLKIKHFAVRFLFRPLPYEDLRYRSTPKFAIFPYKESLNPASLLAVATKRTEGKT